MITSFIDGRVRIRHSGLKDPDVMAFAVHFVKEREGVIDLVPNPRTGSLLITYDPGKVSRERLAQAAKALEKQLGTASSKTGGRKARRGRLPVLAETGVLAGLYGLICITGMFSKRVHIASALLFTGLAVAHVYNRRHCL